MQPFFSRQIEAQQQAEEVLGLLQLAGANRDHLSLLTATLREEINACGEPASSVPLFMPSSMDQRRERLTARLNYLRANSYRLPLSGGSDPRIDKTELDRGVRALRAKLDAGTVSKDDIHAMAIKCARNLAKQRAR
jgi:hypothetical protein